MIRFHHHVGKEVPGCEIMSEEEGPGSGPQPYDSMDWMNNFITAWYDVNQQKVHDLVGGILEKELNKLTPDFIEGITLEEFTFGSGTPSIKGIKSRIVTPKCDSKAAQRKVVFDVIPSIDAPDFEFKLAVKLPLGVKITVAVQKIRFIGNLRITALLSDSVVFPSIQNLCITFTDKPDFGFNVELLDVLNIDTFSIDEVISNILEDVLASKLVYPGRLYVDTSKIGSGGKISTVLMARTANQHPGVVTSSVTVSRINHTTDASKVKLEVELGAQSNESVVELRTDAQNKSKNYLIQDFDADSMRVRAWESRIIWKDIPYCNLVVDLSDMEFTQPNITEEFRNEEKNVLVKVEINAYLLPLISIKQDQTRVIDYRSQFSGMDCDQPKEYSSGVLYVHIHRVEGLSSSDVGGKSDPFVTVYLGEEQVFQTTEVSNSLNPIYNQFKEFIVHDYAGQMLTFKVDDSDVWPNSNDPLGVAQQKLSYEESRLVNKQYRLTTKSTDQTGNVNLYASVIFRGLPLVRDTL